MTVSATSGTSAATAAGASRAPGVWPAGTRPPQGIPKSWISAMEDRDEFHLILGVARRLLERQPSPGTQRAAAQRICRALVALAEDMAEHQERSHG